MAIVYYLGSHLDYSDKSVKESFSCLVLALVIVGSIFKWHDFFFKFCVYIYTHMYTYMYIHNTYTCICMYIYSKILKFLETLPNNLGVICYSSPSILPTPPVRDLCPFFHFPMRITSILRLPYQTFTRM